MAQKTRPLLVQASESEEAGKLESRGIREMLGRLSRKSRSKLAGYIRVSSVALTSCVWLAGGSYAIAQIIPDETWGTEKFVVTPNVDFLIEAGTRRGFNLFHSFERFDITEGGSVYFDSPQGIENIFSRVTGNDASDILGTLGVNGRANLFLINPNGIIFGRNASLDVQGSFVATTANGIQFGEQGFFSTTQSEVPSELLTVNPSAFLFNQITPGRIESRSVAGVNNGQSLLLVGGDILVNGGVLAAPEGRVELAAVAGSGTVGLSVDGNTLSLNVSPEIPRADIALINGAFVTTGDQAGGDIQVWGKQITLADGSQIFSGSFGDGKGGNLVVNASELVQVSGSMGGFESGLRTDAFGAGEAGDLTINTPVLLMEEGAVISSSTFPGTTGNSGRLTVNASDLVKLSGESELLSAMLGSGNGRDLKIQTSQLIVQNGSRISTATSRNGNGNAGNLEIQTDQLLLENGSLIDTANFGQGEGGDITVFASESVQLNNSRLFSGTRGEGDAGNLRIDTPLLTVQNLARIAADPEFIGNAGTIEINTAQLQVDSGGLIATGTFGDGNAGDLVVNATESVQLTGAVSTEEGFLSRSSLTTQTQGEGDGGNLMINTPKLIVADGARVSAETFEQGNGGVIGVNANTVEVTRGGQLRTTTAGSRNAGNILLQVKDSVTISGDDSGLFANTGKDSSGDGGSIIIDPPIVIVQDGAEIATKSEGSGEAGDIEIRADSLILDNHARLSAETATNNGGDITLLIDDLLLLRRGSRISATAGTAGQAEPPGDGGNITIESDFIVAVPNENSDITADSFSGEGGRIRLKTQGLFNLVIRSREELETLLEPDDPLELKAAELQSNDITAISQTVPQLSQIPTLILLGLDPSQGLVELPAELVDVTRLVEQSLCAAAQGSEFIVTGRGGLPKPPNQVLDADATWEDWRITTVGESTEMQQSNQNSYQEVTGNQPNKFVEAQGWFKDANGTIILTAEPTVVTPHATGSPSFTCQ